MRAPPTPSSATSTTSRSPRRRDRDRGAGRARVLGHVRQRLGDDEVDRALDRRGRALRDIHGQADRHRAPGDHRRQRGVETAVLENGRVEAAHEVAQLGERLLRFFVRARDELQRAIRVGGEVLLRASEVHAQGDQALLRAVVEVTFDATALGLGAVERGGAARVQLLDPGLERVAGRRAEQVARGEPARAHSPRPSSTARAARHRARRRPRAGSRRRRTRSRTGRTSRCRPGSDET